MVIAQELRSICSCNAITRDMFIKDEAKARALSVINPQIVRLDAFFGTVRSLQEITPHFTALTELRVVSQVQTSAPS